MSAKGVRWRGSELSQSVTAGFSVSYFIVWAPLVSPALCFLLMFFPPFSSPIIFTCLHRVSPAFDFSHLCSPPSCIHSACLHLYPCQLIFGSYLARHEPWAVSQSQVLYFFASLQYFASLFVVLFYFLDLKFPHCFSPAKECFSSNTLAMFFFFLEIVISLNKSLFFSLG